MSPTEIRSARALLGLTQHQFGLALGVAGGKTVADWEAGRRRASGPVVAAIKMLLKVNGHAANICERIDPHDAAA